MTASERLTEIAMLLVISVECNLAVRRAIEGKADAAGAWAGAAVFGLLFVWRTFK